MVPRAGMSTSSSTLSSAELSTSIARAVELLSRGEVVGLPTETVYGLAGDGTNPEALRKIFALKGRPTNHPLILHLGGPEWLPRYTDRPSDLAYHLARAFWPGPLTLVLRRSAAVPLEVTGGLDTVAVRVPSHPLALRVIRELGRPLAAPSANRFGHVSPTEARHVFEEFGSQINHCLDGGSSSIGIESTILDLTRSPARILRPGSITATDVEQAVGAPVVAGETNDEVRAPGTLPSHYAPRAQVVLSSSGALYDELTARSFDRTALPRSDARFGIFAYGSDARQLAAQLGVNLPSSGSMSAQSLPAGPSLPALELRLVSGEVAEAAHHLYDALRDLDRASVDVIFATLPPPEGMGIAVADRLTRAAAPRSGVYPEDSEQS